MKVNINIQEHPRRISEIEVVEDILERIVQHESIFGEPSGVGVKQNLQLGSSYNIITQSKAEKDIEHPERTEFYVEFYPRAYFEGLKEGLKNRIYNKKVA